jgi:hypothetical protein
MNISALQWVKTVENPEELLDALEEERGKFTKSNDQVMQAMVNELVARGVYPASTPSMTKYGYTHFKMMEGWGARWHLFREPLNCKHCGADLRSESGPPFKREIGIYNHDRTEAFVCPDCKKPIWELYEGAANAPAPYHDH